MKTNANDPANAIHGSFDSEGNCTDDPRNGVLQGGLTKREHFSATIPNNFETLLLSVQETICGESAPYYELENMEGQTERYPTYGEPYVAWLLKGKSKYAVMQADALIEALNK